MKWFRLYLASLVLLSWSVVAQAQSLGSVTNSAGSWSLDLAPDINDDLSKIYGTPFLTVGNQSTFSTERAITAGTCITFTDAGANSTLTVGITTACIDASLLATDSVSADELNATGVESELEAVIDVADLQGFSAVLTEAEAAAAYQPLDADLTSWASVTRASGFDTFTATPSSANLDSLVTDDTGSGALVFATDPDISISATTESNIEAALDTLANVTSIGGDVTAGGDFISTDDLISGDDVLLSNAGVINFGAGDCTLTEGTDTLTIAGTCVLVTEAAGLQVGASVPFSDSAGTLTLQNVDALDATTESTIEAAVDTLANLTSIQGVSLGTITAAGVSILDLADPNEDRVTVWDDNTNDLATGTLTNLAQDASPGTNKPNVLALSAGDVLQWVDWDDLPGAGTGVDNFLDLTDTPDSYAGAGGDCVKVNVGETALEFDTCAAGSGDDLGNHTATEDLKMATFDIDFGTGDVKIDYTANTLAFTGATSSYTFDDDVLVTGIVDASTDVDAGDDVIVGDDIQLSAGALIDMGGGDVVITFTANDLAFTGVTGDYSFDDTVGVTGNVVASVDVTATAGDVTAGDDLIATDDVLLSDTGVINFGAGDCTLTEGTNTLTIAGTCTLITELLTPDGDNTRDLGSAGATWATAHINSIELANGTANTLTATGGALSIEGVTLLPDSTDSVDATNLAPDSVGSSELNIGDAEAEIEGAIDTLANLTSVQSLAIDLDDNNLDELWGWDDDAATFDNFSLADITTEGAPAAGDFLLAIVAEGGLVKIDWDDLPSGSGIANVVEDIDPELGGGLDLNNFDITGTGNINITGAITASTNLTATTGDVTSGDDVIVGDDILLATGAVVNWNSGDVTLTHAADELTIANGELIVEDITNGGTINIRGENWSQLQITVADENATGEYAQFMAFHSDGTLASPLGSDDNDELFWFFAKGYNASLPGYQNAAAIVFAIDGEVATAGDTTDMPGEIRFNTASDGTAGAFTTKWSINSVGHLLAGTDATYDIGSSTVGINDLHFGSGGVINFDGGDVTITHSANDLAFAGVTGDYSFDDTVGVTGDVTASVNVTATAGDVTSGDDIISGDDVLLSDAGVINFNAGDCTLTEGTNTLTIAGTCVLVTEAAGLQVGASVPFSDSAGTLTLQNVDAVDATTESTIEAAIDTLDNVASIGATTESTIEAALDTLANVTSIGGDVTAGGDFTSTDDIISGDDVLLSNAGVINFGAGDCTLTEGTDTLTIAGTCTLITELLTPDGDGTRALGSTAASWAAAHLTTIELGADSDTTFARSAAGEATLEGDAIKHAGKQMFWVGAGAFKNSALNPASCGDAYDSGSNDVSTYVCAYDTGATEENAEVGFAMPKGWNESTITMQVAWTNAAGLTTETVQWKIACTGFGDDDALNTAYPADVTISDTWLAQNDYHLTAETGAITVQNAAENDWVNCRIGRDTSVDNMTGDALLIGVKVYWTDNASTLAE